METQTNKTERYFGITIGPIDRVLEWSKSTMSIWASSYFFSDLARQIIGELIKEDKITEDDFLKPVITNEMLDEMSNKKRGVIGLFPDQYIFKASNDVSMDYIRDHCDKVLENIEKKMAIALEKSSDSDNIIEYLKKTIKIYIIELTSNSEDEKEIISTMHTLMANAECRDIFPSKMENTPQEGGYLEALFSIGTGRTKEKDNSENEDKYKKLREYFFGNNKNTDKLKSFESIPEVSYNKYIAFVSADGDSFGQMVSEDSNKPSIIISEFSQNMRKKVCDYGGQVIYQGGDDISFYAPLIGKDPDQKDKKTDIFGLIRKIDDTLKKTTPTSTISYGIAMAYEKHPMGETRQKAKDLLEYKAKTFEGKNTICWELRKHSGHISSGTIHKGKTMLYESTMNLISTSLNTTTGKKDSEKISEEFLHSVTYFLHRHKEILCFILSQKKRELMLGQYFKNNFNEDIHGSKKDFIATIKNILLKACDEKLKPEDALSYTHSLLRYIHHLLRK